MEKSKTTHISLTEAKQRLGELVKRSSYGGERFVLEFRGRPVAVLTAWDEQTAGVSRRERTIDTLAALKKIREEGREYSSVSFDATEEIRKLREGRAREIDWDRGDVALERLEALRQRIRARIGELPDSSEMIREMRDERETNF